MRQLKLIFDWLISMAMLLIITAIMLLAAHIGHSIPRSSSSDQSTGEIYETRKV